MYWPSQKKNIIETEEKRSGEKRKGKAGSEGGVECRRNQYVPTTSGKKKSGMVRRGTFP